MYRLIRRLRWWLSPPQFRVDFDLGTDWNDAWVSCRRCYRGFNTLHEVIHHITSTH